VTEVPKPLDAALDLLLYAPVGLALTAAEELPKLAAKGRNRIHGQLTMARVVGQFAVTRGRQELERRFTPPAPAAPAGPLAAPVSGNGKGPVVEADAPVAPGEVAAPEVPEPASAVPVAPASAAPPAVAVVAADVPQAGQLAIPGYDSLSASQVVQRLAGLSKEELAAVGAYEQAHRGRRTILNRIDQLQGQ